MKNFLYYLAALVLMWTMSLPVKAVTPDVAAGKVVRAGSCEYNERSVLCVEVEIDGARYIAMLNGAHEATVIFKVRAGAKQPYTNDDMVVVWEKGTV